MKLLYKGLFYTFTLIEKIISEYGWPKTSVFGRQAASTAFLVVQHSELKTQKKYLPLLEKVCENGEEDWDSYALMKTGYCWVRAKSRSMVLRFIIMKRSKNMRFYPLKIQKR